MYLSFLSLMFDIEETLCALHSSPSRIMSWRLIQHCVLLIQLLALERCWFFSWIWIFKGTTSVTEEAKYSHHFKYIKCFEFGPLALHYIHEMKVTQRRVSYTFLWDYWENTLQLLPVPWGLNLAHWLCITFMKWKSHNGE